MQEKNKEVKGPAFVNLYKVSVQEKVVKARQKIKIFVSVKSSRWDKKNSHSCQKYFSFQQQQKLLLSLQNKYLQKESVESCKVNLNDRPLLNINLRKENPVKRVILYTAK